MRIDQKIAKILIHKGQTLAIAESCTGGLLGNQLTDIPGSSAFFWLGIIAYDNKAKTKALRVPPALIKKHGAVSLEVATVMANNVRQILNTHFGVSITGIAGPTGGSALKPVGLVFIAVSSKQQTIQQEYRFKGSRLSIKKQAAQKALHLLLKAL
jgi:nicotinamide-nucleotide amidase